MVRRNGRARGRATRGAHPELGVAPITACAARTPPAAPAAPKHAPNLTPGRGGGDDITTALCHNVEVITVDVCEGRF